MKIEIFAADGCRKCAASQAELREAAISVMPQIEWRVVNVLEELDYAVALGVLGLPSLAVDGELLFAFLPTASQLRTALEKRKSSGEP